MYKKTRELLIYIMTNFNYFDDYDKDDFYHFLQYYRDRIILSKYGD